MQVEHREFILVQAKDALRLVRSGGLYCLAPKGAYSRSVQAGCERGLSPKSRLMHGGQSAGCYCVSELA